jgi:hypothetical protein
MLCCQSFLIWETLRDLSYLGLARDLIGSSNSINVLVLQCFCLCRYAALRRRLLIDPHLSKDVRNSPDLSIDNPLSQNPGISFSDSSFIYSFAEIIGC